MMTQNDNEPVNQEPLEEPIFDAKAFYVWLLEYEEELKNPKPKRGRKATKNYYFNIVTEQAVIAYNGEECTHKRGRIYTKYIHKAFLKLAENIIHTFKFYNLPGGYSDTQNEVIAYLIEKIDKFTPNKGRAFSYFSIVAKNYLIFNSQENYKKMIKRASLDVVDIKRDVVGEQTRSDVKDSQKDFMDLMIEYWDNNLPSKFSRKKDLAVASAIVELFRRRENIEIFNKKALYIMIREMTGIKTQYITKVVKIMKLEYGEMYLRYKTNKPMRNSVSKSIHF
jgi:hypothetical protein